MFRRAGAAANVLMWPTVGCSGGTSPHTILMDYSSDELASFVPMGVTRGGNS